MNDEIKKQLESIEYKLTGLGLFVFFCTVCIVIAVFICK